ncbi:MAG: Ni,Fe-hydrogenase maturation factor [Verrucomicrobiales bacterium]|jgi:Ni,Fe-hydrogenase maturation factor
MLSMGMRYRKARQIPGKADGQKQTDFLEKELRPKLEEAARGERRVFFVDACKRRSKTGTVVGVKPARFRLGRKVAKGP